MAEPVLKKARTDDAQAARIRLQRSAFLSSLSRKVSPPLGSKDKGSANNATSDTRVMDPSELVQLNTSEPKVSSSNVPKQVSSPFQLTRVRGLPAQQNIGAVSLHNILGDPLIRQAWIFDFCFDVDWTMNHFDSDVRQLVDVKIVHGSWRKEDGNRMGIEEDLKKWKNVQAIQAYMPDQFGTHHSKMIILFKHDDTAQIIIHTANMLEKDWDHMSQAVWKSPTLPLKATSNDGSEIGPIGSGSRFKHDLLRYIKAYGSKLKDLSNQLAKFDFSAVRAALIASVPSYVKVSDTADKKWGHLLLRDFLQQVHSSASHQAPQTPQHLVCQVSSIATLPATWLDDTLFKAASTNGMPPSTSIIYPTPTDLRNAITGYATGGSIHTKIASAAQQKQVTSIRPHLHRWGVQQANAFTQAGRHQVPPHIKTYVCFKSKPIITNPTPDISWALVTSANLSQQAWGTAAKPPKGVKDPSQAVSHISSFEIGVLVWPELFLDEAGEGEDAPRARMVPVFGKDVPDAAISGDREEKEVVIGFRMPYDLPLTPYGAEEMPWSPSAAYDMPDRFGQTWP